MPIDEKVLENESFKKLKNIGRSIADKPLTSITLHELLKAVFLGNIFKLI